MATITTINATDKVGDSRAVINTNFTNLNNAKIEAVSVTGGDFTGDGTSGTPLTLASVTTGGSFSFVSLTADAKGRVSGLSSGTMKDLRGLESSVDITSSTNTLTLDTGYNMNCHILTENTTLQVPDVSGWANGTVWRCDFFVKVDAGGSYALSFHASWSFDGGTTPTLTATASAVDHLVITVSKSAATGTVYAIGLAAANIS